MYGAIFAAQIKRAFNLPQKTYVCRFEIIYLIDLDRNSDKQKNNYSLVSFPVIIAGGLNGIKAIFM